MMNVIDSTRLVLLYNSGLMRELMQAKYEGETEKMVALNFSRGATSI